MHRFLAVSVLALAFAAGPIANAQPGAAPAIPATPAIPAIPNGPGEPATPAVPAVPADSPAANTLPPGTPTIISNELPPPPASALNKSYPLCTRALQDNCQNRGESEAPGRSKAGNARRRP